MNGAPPACDALRTRTSSTCLPAACLALLLTVASSCGPGRWPGNWHLRVACLGDSNTFRATEGATPPSWCEYLGDLGARRLWRTVNLGRFGASAVDTGVQAAGVSLSASDWVQRAIDAGVDVAVLNYGTNDVRLRRPPDEIVAALMRHRERLERFGIEVYVATIPLLYPPAPTGPNDAIDAFNAALRAAVPAGRLIDFAAVETVEAFRTDGTRVPLRDGLHVNDAAQRRRAQLVYDALQG